MVGSWGGGLADESCGNYFSPVKADSSFALSLIDANGHRSNRTFMEKVCRSSE